MNPISQESLTKDIFFLAPANGHKPSIVLRQLQKNPELSSYLVYGVER